MPPPLNLTITYGGVDFPILFDALIEERAIGADGVEWCVLGISGAHYPTQFIGVGEFSLI